MSKFNFMSKVKIILKSYMEKSPMTLNVLFSALAISLIPDMAHAWAVVSAGTTDPGNIICNIGTYARGNVGKGVATVAVVSLGIGAAFGRASWTQAIMIMIGVTIVIGAAAALTSIGLSGC